MRSELLNYIIENPDDWERTLNEKRIRTTHDGNRVCFKYEMDADFSDPLVCESRGIVIDLAERKVVCRPFDKFFNVQEEYAADIDWNTAKVLEKIDGSLIKLYWYKDAWVFATSSTCDARSATVKGQDARSYLDVITKADNYSEIHCDDLDKSYTYMFELISPMTQVVIRYEETSLYFLAARNNETGEESDTMFGDFRRPRSFSLRTLDDCLKAADELNSGISEKLTDEGFVVVDGACNRVKIKSPAYIAMHRSVDNRRFTPGRMVEMYLKGVDLAELAKEFPDDAYVIKYYDWQFEEIRHKIARIAGYAVSLYEEYDHDRRAVASMIKDSPFAWAGFMALDNDKTPDEMMKMLAPSKLEKYISEYKYE